MSDGLNPLTAAWHKLRSFHKDQRKLFHARGRADAEASVFQTERGALLQAIRSGGKLGGGAGAVKGDAANIGRRIAHRPAIY